MLNGYNNQLICWQMDNLGLDEKSLAGLAGVDRGTVVRFMKGENITTLKLKLLCAALKLNRSFVVRDDLKPKDFRLAVLTSNGKGSHARRVQLWEAGPVMGLDLQRAGQLLAQRQVGVEIQFDRMILLNDILGKKASRFLAEQIDPLRLPSVPFLEVGQLPDVRGVYFAIYEERVVYIGLTRSLKQRWANHSCLLLVKDRSKSRVAWIEVASPKRLVLHRLEADLIRKFQPALNVAHVKVENRLFKKSGSIVHSYSRRREIVPVI